MKLDSPTVSRSRAASGFTLMELILAIGVTAVVLIAINGILFSALRLRQSTLDAVDSSLPMDRAASMIRQDLQGAMSPRTNGVFAGGFRAGNISSTGFNLPVSIELYTTTGALRATEPWGEVQRVAYGLRSGADPSAPGKDLVRSVTRNILANITPQSDDQVLVRGVETITFSCYDGTQWRDDWDTTLGDTNLPIAVRVRIQLSGDGNDSHPVEMVVPVDAQPRLTPARN